MSRRLFARILLLGTSFAVAAAIAELAFRLLLPDTSRYSVAATGNQYHFYRFDAQLGWANTPGARGTFARGEFSYDVAINSHGMRQAELPLRKPDGVRRIAVLGDSFVWGIGVADEDRFTERVAARLADVEVLNFGVSGYGSVQHLLSLDRVLQFAPDLVVLTFCLGNDFVDDVQYVRYGYYKPYAAFDERGELCVQGHPLPDTKAFGFVASPRWFGSVMLGALRHALAGSPPPVGQRGLGRLDEASMYDAEAKGEVGAQRRLALAIGGRLLGRIAERLRAAGVPLLVVPAPTKFEYHPRGGTGHEGRFPVLEDALLELCRANGIACVPMVDRLHGDDFWREDGHWNVGGHDKVAQTIAEHLVGVGYARRR